MEGIMKAIDHNRFQSPPERASSRKSYVIPEMTASDVLEAIQDWMEKHPERMKCHGENTQNGDCESNLAI